MHGFGFGSEHHVSFGGQIVLLQLPHQESDHAGGCGVACISDSVQPAVPRLLL